MAPFSPTSENLLKHSSHYVLVSRGFCLRQFASLVSAWCVLAKLSPKPRNETIAETAVAHMTKTS